jgi:phosphatidylinositol 4-kinase
VSLASSQLINHYQPNVVTSYTPVSSIAGHPDCLKDTRSQPLSSLALQTQHLGAVKATISLLGDSAFKDLVNKSIRELESAVEKKNMNIIATTLFNLTALLITCKVNETIRIILHSVVDVPIKSFHGDIISMATHCWLWLLNSSPHWEYTFMREFCSLWEWTINERKGMFASAGNKLKASDIQPHTVLIEFLIQRFEVFHTRNTSLVSLTSQLIHQSLTLGVGPKGIDQDQRLSPSIVACSTRFKFLTLALQLIRRGLVTNAMDRTILREKIYNSALDYFCYCPSWIVGNINGIREAMTSLIKFWQGVKDMKNAIATSQIGGDLPVTSIPRNSSFWQALATDGSTGQGSWLNTMSSRNSSKGQAVNLPPTSASRRSGTNAKSRVLLKRRNLILALIVRRNIIIIDNCNLSRP